MPKSKINKQYLLAHRGYSAIAPENTQLAFDVAHLYGFDGVEIDVHLSADNELVIIHDETTNRTALSKYKIQNSKYSTLKKVDLAAFFPISCPKQSMMTLKEFLDRYLAVFKVINIEIKTDLIEYENIEKLIHNLASKYKSAKEKIIFSSFNFQSLERMYQLDNQWKLGFLFWTKSQFNAVDHKRMQKICKFLHPWTDLYEKMPREIRKYKMPLCLWTLKNQKKYDKFLKDPLVHAQISNYKYK